jgi:hypothetical protein
MSTSRTTRPRPPATTQDAGSYDAHWIDPGIECIKRETARVQEQNYKPQEKAVMLETQIDVLSGAYSLREQLSKAGPGEAQRIANAVVLDAGTPERLAVAIKYLKDKTEEFNAEEHEAHRDLINSMLDGGHQ